MTKRLSATPSSVDFGVVPIGKSKIMTVELLSTGTQYPTVTAASCVGDDDFSGGAADEDVYPLMVALGKIWTPTDTDLPPRRSFGCTKMGDYIYVVGGRRDDVDATVYNDCRRSLDGVTWETMSLACFDVARSDLALFNINDKLYAVGGLVDGVATDEVWESVNYGASWVLVGNTEEPVARMAYCQRSTVLYYFGGIDDTGTLVNKVAASTDGIDWSTTATAAAVSPRKDADLVYLSDKLYVLCGYDATGTLDECWQADVSDLTTWTEKGQPFDGSPRAGIAAIVAPDTIFVHGGMTNIVSEETSSSQSLIRYTVNAGVTWTTLDNTYTGRAYHAIQSTAAGKVVLIGGKGWSQ